MSQEITLICPFCGDKPGQQHFYVSPAKSVYHCFLCDASGTLKGLFFKHPGLKPVIEMKIGGALEVPAYVGGTISAEPLSITNSVMGRTALAFLKKRGLTEADVAAYKVMMSAQLPHRVVFPDLDGGFRRFWAARLVIGGKPKWLFPKTGQTQQTKGEVVWGLGRIPPKSPIWVCEGVFDAIPARGVAIFGKKPSTTQMRAILAKEPTRLYIGFDNDAVADAAVFQKIMRPYVASKVAPPPREFKDYGEMLQAGYRRGAGEEFVKV